jgi:hypothetical protein
MTNERTISGRNHSYLQKTKGQAMHFRVKWARVLHHNSTRKKQNFDLPTLSCPQNDDSDEKLKIFKLRYFVACCYWIHLWLIGLKSMNIFIINFNILNYFISTLLLVLKRQNGIKKFHSILLRKTDWCLAIYKIKLLKIRCLIHSKCLLTTGIQNM